MSEKQTKTPSGGGATSAPNKMRLYATWVDRTPSNCIPRLCSLTLTRLVLLKPLGTELSSISIAVKMQNSKRTLRSHELILPGNGLLDTPLDVTFCLQYPHFLKREGNKLHILLQRRKRYKNRTMLGFKTLAVGIIRMDQVLQKQMDMELELSNDGGNKEKNAGPVARLSVLQLSSTPVDHEQKVDRDFSDDEDEISSGEEEPGDLSDSEPLRGTKLPHTRHNLKQRFVSLLRRFKVPDSEGGRTADLDNPSDIQALFQELESLSCDEESGGEQDTMSISSTPKPSLRPFFSSSRSLLDSNQQLPYIESNDKFIDGELKNCSGSDGNADVCYTDPEAQSDPQTGSPPRDHQFFPQQPPPPPPQSTSTKKTSSDNDFANIMQELSERKSKLFRSSASAGKKKNSLSVSSDTPAVEVTARKVFLELITKLLPLEENVLPECVALVVGPDNITQPLIARLSAHHKVFQPLSAVETKAVLSGLFNKIHKYCNSYAKPGTFIKLLLIGGDTLIGWFVRPYVELLSSKPSDWLSYTRIFIVPIGQCNLTRQLSNLDQGYSALFPYDTTNQTQQQQQIDNIKIDELVQRIYRYLNVPPTAPLAQLPIGEAMLTCHDENSQLFIPFVYEVRVGPIEHTLSVSVDMDDLMSSCSSPPSAPPPPPSITPPSSPNVQARDSPWEPLELQLDYWQLPKYNDQQQTTTTTSTTTSIIKTDKTTKQQDSKISMKALFRGLQAMPTTTSGLNITIHLANKEKKQKIMRLGKKKDKEKETEPRSQTVDGVSRLICSARASHTTPMKVYIDGVEFNGVKFFQLSSTWQTHVKSLSVALLGVPLASVEIN